MAVKKVTPELVDKIKTLYELGVSVPKLCTHLKLSRATAYLIKNTGFSVDAYFQRVAEDEVRRKRAIEKRNEVNTKEAVENASTGILGAPEAILEAPRIELRRTEDEEFHKELMNKVDLMGKVLVDLVNVQKDLLAMEQAKEMARKAYNAQKAEQQKRRFF